MIAIKKIQKYIVYINGKALFPTTNDLIASLIFKKTIFDLKKHQIWDLPKLNFISNYW